MKKLNLMLHCGADEVERKVLDMVPTPESTDSWQPIPHHQLVGAIEERVKGSGFEIVQQVHGLTREGDRYFGMIQVANGSNPDDYGLVIGIRNSHDKSFPAALALGAGVFVCDNLSFSGEIKLARRHTRFISRDLPQLVSRAVGMLGGHREVQTKRIACYKETELKDAEAHDAIINALDARVIGTNKVMPVLKEWREPSHDEFRPRTVWSLFNAFTEVLKGNATNALPRTQALHGLCDHVCGLSI